MREGYKKTEVGIIPEDWEVKNLIDVADENDRYSFTGGPFGSDLKSCHYTEDGVRVIQLQNIGDGYFNDDYKIYTSVEKADELKGCNIYPGDIIIAKMAEPVARACMIPKKEERYLMCSDGIRLNVDCFEYDKNYILYSINSSYFRKNAEANSTGSTRLRIGLSQLKELKIIKPPLKEQEKIAEILLTVDSQIDDTEKLIEKSKELKKGLIQKLLTKGIGHSEFKKTEVGEIPVSWEVKRLDSLCELIDGDRSSNYPSGNDIVDHGIIFLSTSNIKNNKLDYSDLKFITEEKFKSLRKGKLEKNDIIITLRGTIGSVAIFDNDNYETGFINAQMLIIRPKLANSNYLHNYLTSYIFKKQLEVISSGSAQPQLTKRDLSSIKIVLPSNNEQEKISNILLSIDNEIEEYENKKQKLEYIKRGLMQQLLTGKIRTII